MTRWVIRILGLLLIVMLLIMLFNMQKKLIELQRARTATGSSR